MAARMPAITNPATYSFASPNGAVEAGFERAAASEGEDGFARRYAHAQFRDYARRLDKGVARYEDLPDTLDGTLGRLDADAARKLVALLTMPLSAYARSPRPLQQRTVKENKDAATCSP